MRDQLPVFCHDRQYHFLFLYYGRIPGYARPAAYRADASDRGGVLRDHPSGREQ